MKQVNLRELYPDSYEDNEYVDVSDEVYETLCEFERKEAAIARQKHRHEAELEIMPQASLKEFVESAEALVLNKLTVEELDRLLKSLPEKQAKRVYDYFYLGLTTTQIAAKENTPSRRIAESIQRGLMNLRERINVNFL